MNLRSLATALALALLAPSPAPAQGVDKNPPAGEGARLAQQPAAAAHIEVLVLEGTAGDGGVAPSLANIPQLRQPPFSAYSQITLVSRATLPLAATPASTPTPNGGTARVTLSGRTPEGRYTVDVAFVQGARTNSIQFVAGAGEPFFTVRSRRPDRALIFGFIVRQ